MRATRRTRSRTTISRRLSGVSVKLMHMTFMYSTCYRIQIKFFYYLFFANILSAYRSSCTKLTLFIFYYFVFSNPQSARQGCAFFFFVFLIFPFSFFANILSAYQADIVHYFVFLYSSTPNPLAKVVQFLFLLFF